jgi:hypothetical protein
MRSPRPSLVALALSLALAGSLAGCEALGVPAGPLGVPLGGGRMPDPPQVRVADVRLVQSPTEVALGTALCAQLATEQRLPGALLCGALAGGMPGREELTFAFEVELEIDNPNRVPLPLAQALVGFRAWPEQADVTESLGVVCVSLCEDPEACPSAGPDACRSADPEIRDLGDFASAAAGFLIAVARGDREVAELRLRTVPPRESVRAVLRLELDPERMLGLVRRLSSGAVADVRAGRAPSLEVPYELEGSVWVGVEGFGRLAAGFGPHRDAWRVR